MGHPKDKASREAADSFGNYGGLHACQPEEINS